MFEGKLDNTPENAAEKNLKYKNIQKGKLYNSTHHTTIE